MDDLSMKLARYMKEANAAMAGGNLKLAHEMLVHAAQCKLLMAKAAVGDMQKKHLADVQTLKASIDKIEAKIKLASPTVNDLAANFAPKTPTAAKETASTPKNEAAHPLNTAPSHTATPQSQTGARDGKYGQNDVLSPRYLNDYIGQPDAVAQVGELINAARLKNSALPHLMIYGSNGLGKTTFAKIIANEMGAEFKEINVTKTNPQEMAAVLKGLKPKDILFIDEIHTIPLVVAESLLYSAMQDGRITYTEGKGKLAKSVTLDLPPFTLIGATTEIGKLAKPFTHRAITVHLKEYTDEVLGGIVKSSVTRLGMNISLENAVCVAKRCRNNPRTANNIVRRITDKALVRFVQENNLLKSGPFDTPDKIRRLNIEISMPIIEEFFADSGIDEYGLEDGDRELLKIIIERYNGGPVGLDNLARTMNESNNVIAQKYEAYLIKKGLVRVDRDGRVAMPAAYTALGLEIPKEKLGENGDGVQNGAPPMNNRANDYASSTEDKKSRYDHMTINALELPDALKCEKIEELITYPENAVAVDKSLDELFFAVEKPEVEFESSVYCLDVKFPFGMRELVCDSKLESKFATALAATGYVTDIMAQTLEIPYVSQELANRRYFPDFVFKDYKGRIAVVEMKNYDMVSYHLNIDKYEMLRRYCESMGYGYAEIMKPYNSETYISAKMIEDAPINRALEEYIFQTIETSADGMFSEEDFKKYCDRYGTADRGEVYTILLNNRRLKNKDRVGNDFKIYSN